MSQTSHQPSSSSRDTVKSLENIAKEAAKLAGSADANEATTRVLVVDRVLAALGWTDASISRERGAGVGTYLDYELRTQLSGWMVVEAKRIGKTFSLAPPSSDSRASSLRAIKPLLRTGGTEFKEAMAQAADYCNHRGIALACVTNGTQWLFFRGLSQKGRSWQEGIALVFLSFDEIIARYDEFARGLSFSFAGSAALYELLDHQTTRELPTATRPIAVLRPSRPKLDDEQAPFLRSAADYLLSDIYGEERGEMLEQCHIEPGAAPEFSRSIERLLRDSTRTVSEAEPHEVMDGDALKFVAQVDRQAQLTNILRPVVVVGHVGAGKTTFLHRALGIYRTKRDAFCAIVSLEGFGRSDRVNADEECRKVAALVIEKLHRSAETVISHREDLSVPAREKQALLTDPHSRDVLRAIFGKQIKEELELGAKLWEADPAAWNKREYEILSGAKRNSLDLLIKYVRYLRGQFARPDAENGRYPVLIVLDNVDQESNEYQRCIYGVAQQIASTTFAVVVVCLREDTYNAAVKPGGFLTSSPLQFVFHVASPGFDKVLRARVKYVRRLTQAGGLPTWAQRESVSFGKCVQRVEDVFLVPKSEAVEITAAIAGHNVRLGLSIVRGVLLGGSGTKALPNPSPQYVFECLLSAHGTETLVNSYSLNNVFDADAANPPFHALRLRLLAYLSWAAEQAGRVVVESTRTLIERFGSWGYPISSVRLALEDLLQSGMVRPFDRYERSAQFELAELPERIVVTASGYVHLDRLAVSPAFRAMMALRGRWYDAALQSEFLSLASAAGGEDGPTVADVSESGALDIFDAYLADRVEFEDAFLAEWPDSVVPTWQREVVQRCKEAIFRDSTFVRPQAQPSSRNAKVSEVQLALPSIVRGIDPGIGVTKEASFLGSQWLARALWVLWRQSTEVGAKELSVVAIARSIAPLRLDDNTEFEIIGQLQGVRKTPGFDRFILDKKETWRLTPAGERAARALGRG